MIQIKEVMKKFDKDFLIEHLDARPINISGLARGFVNGLKLREYDTLLAFFKDDQLDWVTLWEDQIEIFKKMVAVHMKDNEFWFKELKDWLKKKKKLEQTFKNLKYKDLKNISDNGLIQDMDEFFTNQTTTRRVSSLIDAFNFASFGRIRELLKEYKKTHQNIDINHAFEVLTKTTYESYINKAENELREIKKELPEKELTEDDIKNNEKIKKHREKYIWMKTISFTEGKEYTFNDIAEELNSLKPKEREKKSSKEKEKLIRLFGKDSELSQISILVDLFLKWQDLRKENTMMSTYLATKYVKEIARRREMNFVELSYLDYWELKEQFKNGFEETLKERRNGVVLIFHKDQFKSYLFKDIPKLLNKIFKKEEKEVNKLKGMCASKGIAKGEAKIIMKISEINKVNEGDILIAPTTRPEHMPAMRKAAAFVTDEGGVTSHAAIVSREMKKPCIIGTHKATKVFKDNDLIEVDADKGVVRKIK